MNMSLHLELSESFYNSIAEAYDGLMTESDKTCRATVAELFTRHVSPGYVLDFGGGTGLDLPWLVSRNNVVFFLEPSPGMRQEARRRMGEQARVTILERDTDFEHWTETALPFTEKMDGVLANFAVLNCVADPPALFAKIRLVMKPAGALMVTVIDPRLSNIIRNYSAGVAFRILTSGHAEMLHRHKGIYHKTYLHAIRALKKASEKYFSLKCMEPVPGSGFIVLVFQSL